MVWAESLILPLRHTPAAVSYASACCTWVKCVKARNCTAVTLRPPPLPLPSTVSFVSTTVGPPMVTVGSTSAPELLASLEPSALSLEPSALSLSLALALDGLAETAVKAGSAEPDDGPSKAEMLGGVPARAGGGGRVGGHPQFCF